MKRHFLILVTLLACFGGGLSAAPTYDQAFELYMQQRFKEALTAFQQVQTERDDAEVRLWIGWSHYRLGDIEEAEASFRGSLALRPDHPEAETGLAFIALRQGQNPEALELFEKALLQHPKSKDALLGAGLALYRMDRPFRARERLGKLLELEPEHGEALQVFRQLENLQEPEAPLAARKDLVRPEELVWTYRAGKDYLEVLQDGQWSPVLLHGVNLGAALPGRHPSEFPQSREFYLDWLQQMAEMGCNVVRVYTILPPSFYEAFWQYQQDASNSPLWLIHGVWTELPEDDDFLGQEFYQEFLQEMHRVVDLLHGQADIPRRPGHASGTYNVDVSPWVLGYILGREWEPYSVEEFAALHPNYTYQGTYFSCQGGNPTEAWMAQVCDEIAVYEMERYHAQRPIAFTNWPTLDPLHHISEATKDEEIRLMAERGEFSRRELREYDNDAVDITSTNIEVDSSFQAGIFASYHAYPYYPDFMVNEEHFGEAVGRHGQSHYLGYLKNLKAHYGDMPLLISEYGVPSSRGNAHVQPQGYDHGGHTEIEQAEINVKLTDDIVDAGCAGAILFAWIDEWFKKNWVVIDVEIPLDRNRMWLNPLDPEQNYGIIAMRPGAERLFSTLVGSSKEWAGAEVLARRRSQSELADTSSEPGLKTLKVHSDEGWLYLAIELLGLETLNFDRYGIAIGIDTIEPELGEHRFPPPFEVTTQQGLEFLILIEGEQDSRLLVAEDYQPYRKVPIQGTDGEYAQVRNPFMQPQKSHEGKFVPIVVETNRRRIGRDGTVYPAQRLEWGALSRGSLDSARADFNTLADWNLNGNLLELRIPWGLLHITDPSSHQAIFQAWETGDVETKTTEGFHFLVCLYERGSGETKPRVVEVLPPQQGQPYSLSRTFKWQNWERPSYHWEFKETYYRMRDKFRKFDGRVPR